MSKYQGTQEVYVNSKLVGYMNMNDNEAGGLVYAKDCDGTIGFVRDGKFEARNDWHRKDLDGKYVVLPQAR